MPNFYVPAVSPVSIPSGTTWLQPTVATPAVPATTRLLKPTFTLVASGKNPYIPWTSAILDGIAYFANGYDQAWYADVNTGAFWPLGSVAPTSFNVADAAGGATFPIGTTLVYFLVFRDDARGEETAPQPTNDASGTPVAGVTHVMGATKDALITWTPSEATARFTSVAIYRRRQNDNGFVRVAVVASSAGTYTDSTPDSALSTAAADLYVDRFRLTLPPIFKGIAAHLGRLFGFTGTDANLYFGQQVLQGSSELVQTDFPARNIQPIEPDDGLGEITAILAHYDVLLVFKRRGCYALEGDDPDTWTVRRLFADRGCLGARLVVSVMASLVFLDEQGLFAWAPSAEPVIVAAKGAVAASPLAPIWRGNLNLDAVDMMQLVHNEALGYVEAWVALDNSPQARNRVRWNYRQDRYESIDDGMVSCAAGILDDGAGMQHRVRVDDLGLLWEQDVGDSEGVYAGTVVARITGGTNRTPACVGAAFSTDDLLGPFGCPVDRVGPTGLVLDENRAWAATSGTLTMLRWSSVAVAVSQVTAVGSIRDLWEPGFFDFGTGDWKVVDRLILEFEVEAAGVLRVDSTMDERAYTLRREIPLSSAAGWAYVPCFDRGFRWKHRASSRYAGWGYTVRADRIDWRAHRRGV